MALMLEVEQRLDAVGLIELFNNDKEVWTDAAFQAYQYIKRNFPGGATIRRDDVAKALTPVLAVNQSLQNALNFKKLRQKYWTSDFTDLIIDRSWTVISKKGNDND